MDILVILGCALFSLFLVVVCWPALLSILSDIFELTAIVAGGSIAFIIGAATLNGLGSDSTALASPPSTQTPAPSGEGNPAPPPQNKLADAKPPSTSIRPEDSTGARDQTYQVVVDIYLIAACQQAWNQMVERGGTALRTNRIPDGGIRVEQNDGRIEYQYGPEAPASAPTDAQLKYIDLCGLYIEPATSTNSVYDLLKIVPFHEMQRKVIIAAETDIQNFIDPRYGGRWTGTAPRSAPSVDMEALAAALPRDLSVDTTSPKVSLLSMADRWQAGSPEYTLATIMVRFQEWAEQALLPAPAVTNISTDESDLNWKLKTECSPMDKTCTKSAIALDDFPEAGVNLQIEESCKNGVFLLEISAFDSNGKPLAYAVSDENNRAYVRTRLKYDNESPKTFDVYLDEHYINSLSIQVSGNPLHSLAGANAIMYELPLSNGRRVFPVIRPHNAVFDTILRPCLSSSDKAEQKRSQEEQVQREADRVRDLCQQLKSCVGGCQARSSNPRYYYGDACSASCRARYSAMPDGACP